VLRLASDADFNGDVVRGLFRRLPQLDLVRVQDVGLRTADDRAILTWAAAGGPIVLTHDRASMPDLAWERVRSGQPMPGVFVMRNRPAIGQMIEEILLVIQCSSQEERQDRVEYLPL
jgi:predicted nuclease of predicted toxin-antitoxin system